MARYKDVEGYRKLFDEEYKKTRKLISEGETHLDNLAEGFSEASSVLDRIPTADVVPKSEVLELENKLRPLEDKLRQYEQICGNIVVKDGVAVGLLNGKETVYISKNIAKVTKELAIRRTRQEVAREIFEEIEKYIAYRRCGNGLIDDWIEDDIAELKKKYTEGEQRND